MSLSTITSASQILVGVDWADAEHAVHVLFPDGRVSATQVEQTPEALDAWIAQLGEPFPDGTIAIALEQKHGALVAGLLKFPHVRLYPINPAQLANYRKAVVNSGAKSDPSDAQLLAQFLQHYQDQLRPLKPDDAQTRELALLAQDRRTAVDQRTALTLELKSTLKQYFPLVLLLVQSKLYAQFICRLLLKWPTLGELQKAKRHTVRNFFYANNLRGDHIEQKLDQIDQAVALTEDPALLSAGARRAKKLAQLLLVLNQTIGEYDEQMAKLLEAHADYEIFKSLPGAALQMQARLLTAFGTDRDRFDSAEQIQALSGIAPVTRQSGKSRIVSHRWACPKFLKQTFHEYAGLSIKQSKWANAYYTLQRKNGKTAQMAKRALAYKWMRIIFRCWKNRVPYDEAKYIESLKRAKSPLLACMDNETKP
jgi:transposase